MPSPAPDGWTSVVLSVGSNLGDPPEHLHAALDRLRARGHLLIDALSDIYRTKPWGPIAQGDFANLCLIGRTDLPPLALLTEVKGIEAEVGRRPGLRWGPRIVDIDIITFGDLRMADDRLTLPHPRAGERSFVMVPLAQIAPDLEWEGTTVGERAAALHDSSVALWAAAADTERTET